MSLVAKAQGEEPIITFHTTIYDEDGEDNAFSLVFGSTTGDETIYIDCGYGKEKLNVAQAYIEGDSTLVGSTFAGNVTKEGVVKVYGDATKIDYFNASGCCITDIEFDPSLNLKILNLEYNTLKSLDIDSMSNLQVLYLTDNPFTAATPLQIGYLPNLVLLDVHQVGYVSPDFDLGNFPLLTSFDAFHCLTLKKADTLKCPYIVRLSLNMTQVETLDLSNNPYLQILNISDTRIKNVDLSPCPLLSEFYCSHASSINSDITLDAIDVTKNPQLYVLSCGYNNISSLDLSQNPILFDLATPHNNLTSIDLSNNPDLYNVNLRNNYMDYATLPLPEQTWGDYTYPQNELVLDDTYKVGDVIDLSKRVLREGTTTSAVVYTDELDESYYNIALDDSYYTYEDGKITFLKPYDQPLFIAFSNDVFSDYDLYTEKFNIRAAEDFGKDIEAFNFASGTAAGEAVEMGVGIVGASKDNPVNVTVDFGDGEYVPFAVTEEIPTACNVIGTRKSTGNIKMNVPQDHYVSALTTDGLSITNIDLNELTDLRVLKLRNAGLYSVDLSYNKKLEQLDLSGNNISEFSLSGPSFYYYKSKLSDINLSNNKLTAFTFDDLYAVKNLNLSNNQLTEIDFSDADDLLNIDVSGNQFSILVFSNSDSLRTLNASGNILTAVYVPADAPLSACNISDNYFTLADMDTLIADYGRSEFIYAPQKAMKIAKKSPGVDLSSQYVTASGASTQYIWRKADGTALEEGTDYTISAGSTKFLNTSVGEVYCEMTHEAYPQFAGENVFRTTLVTPITMPTVEIASFTTPKNGETVELSLASVDDGASVYFDWNGDGNVTQYDLTTTYTRFDATTKGGANVRVLVADKTDKLNVFSITGATMKDLNLSGLDKAFAISICDAGLTEFNMAKSTSLGELNLSGNSLQTLDLSKYPNLYYLSLNGNDFTSIDLGKVEGLGLAYLGNNKLKEIKFNNPNLWNLDLGSNDFDEVSFDGAANIEQLWVNDNKLTSIDVDALNKLRVLNVVGNKMTFSTLPVQKSNWAVYSYGKQANLDVVPEGNIIDLSSEAAVGDSLTTFRWFIGTPTVNEDTEELEGDELSADDFSIVNGVTTFNFTSDTDDIVGVLTNDQFPNLTLYTNPVTVSAADGIGNITMLQGSYDAVYSTDGRLVGKNIKSLQGLVPGVYIVTSNGHTSKVIIK